MTRDEFIFKKVWPDRCWHKPEGYPFRFGFGPIFHRCSLCKKECEFNPDFSSKSGFFMLLKGMQEHERWNTFMSNLLTDAGFFGIDMLPIKYINPPAFADAVAAFFGWEGG